MILTTPIAQLEMAMDGRLAFHKATNPNLASDEDVEAKKLAEQQADPALAASQMLAFFKRQQQQRARTAKKKNL